MQSHSKHRALGGYAQGISLHVCGRDKHVTDASDFKRYALIYWECAAVVIKLNRLSSNSLNKCIIRYFLVCVCGRGKSLNDALMALRCTGNVLQL